MRYTPLAMILVGLVFTICALFVTAGQAVGHLYMVETRERGFAEALDRMDIEEIRRVFEVPADESDPKTYAKWHVNIPQSYFDTYSNFALLCLLLGIILLVWGVAEFVVRRHREGLAKQRRDQGHCISCGYERGGPNAPVPCSECGHV